MSLNKSMRSEAITYAHLLGHDLQKVQPFCMMLNDDNDTVHLIA